MAYIKKVDLISGTTIKTINGSSVLGGGDLVVTGGSAISIIPQILTQSQFNAALAAGTKLILLGEGTFNMPDYHRMEIGDVIRGMGSTKTIINVGDVYGFYIPSGQVEVSGLTLDGGNVNDYTSASYINVPVDVKTSVNAGTKTGIYAGGANNKFSDITVRNFNYTGINLAAGGGGSTPEPMSNFMNNIIVDHCYYGVRCTMEYSILQNLAISHCACGILVNAGNVSLTSSNFTLNTIDYAEIGGGNDSHSGVTNCAFNHANSTRGACLYIVDTVLEKRFVNCSFYDGDIILDNSKGVVFNSCGIACAFRIKGGSGNRVTNCTFYDAYRNGQGFFNYTNGGTVIARGNYTNDGLNPLSPINTLPPSYANNAAAIAVIQSGSEYINSTTGALSIAY